MTTNTVKNLFLELQSARDTLESTTQDIKQTIDKAIVKRFFEYLRNNPTYGYVDMDFTDPADPSQDAFDALVVPAHHKAKDFKLSLKDSDSRGLYYQRKSDHLYGIGQHFVIPLEYFDNPQKWENDLEIRIDNDHVNAFNALLKVFPELAESRANNEINVNMTIDKDLGKEIVAFNLDQTPLRGAHTYNHPFEYNGITYGKRPDCFIYVKPLNTIYYNPQGFHYNANFLSMELTHLPTPQELESFDWNAYDVNNPLAKLVYRNR